MVRDVDLVSYLPPFLQEYKENVAALTAENPEFTLIWNAQNKVLYNCFIETADAYGISRYESLLGIYPTSDDTLESRRSRVRIQWARSIPYTIAALIEKLTVLCGEDSFILSHNFRVGYTLTLVTYLENYGQVEELNNLLQEMLPCNIVIDSTNQILCNAYGNYYWASRLATHASIVLSTDFNETWAAKNGAVYVGYASPTERVTISTDFNESWTPTANVKAASAIGYCDVFEIKSE